MLTSSQAERTRRRLARVRVQSSAEREREEGQGGSKGAAEGAVRRQREGEAAGEETRE
jgi:hypothetical protein